MTNRPAVHASTAKVLLASGLPPCTRRRACDFRSGRRGSAQGTIKVALGALNLPILSAGQIVRPRDLVLTDADGVVVVAMAAAPQPGAPGQAGADRARLLAGRVAARPRRPARNLGAKWARPTEVEG